MTHPALHSVSVSAVVTNDLGQVLMVCRRDNGRWEPPGGVLERHESIDAGLKREVQEETGLEVQPDRLTGVYKNINLGVIALVFRAHVVNGQLNPQGPETTSVDWLTPHAINDRCDEAYAVRIRDALTSLAPEVRLHDGVRLLDS